MEAKDFDEFAGRIEGVGRAVLQLAALLETREVIDGPLLSQRLHQAVPPHSADTPLRQAARRTLQDLARALDDARAARRSPGH